MKMFCIPYRRWGLTACEAYQPSYFVGKSNSLLELGQEIKAVLVLWHEVMVKPI